VLQLGAGTQPVAAGATRAEPPAGDTPQEEYSQWTSFENAVAESRRSGKPVMIDFSADWCGPCQRLKREVFDDPGNGHVVQTTVIPVSIVDRVQERGSNPPDVEDLQRRYQVQAFPTLVVFSPASGRSLQTRGFADAERTLAWIKSAAHSVR
jgi:thiol:disulfide interchange protein DsbD